MVPKDVHVPIPRPVNVNLHVKSNFTEVTKLRILKWEDYSDYLGGANVITLGFMREGRRVTAVGDIMIKQEADLWQAPWAKGCGCLLEGDESKGHIVPGMLPTDTLTWTETDFRLLASRTVK